jgi:hypothetical protein
MERGMEPPAWFFDQPEIWFQNQFYWNAFNELSSERQIGMGLGPIPLSAIRRYAEEWELDGDEYEVFYSIIRKMDIKYLDMTHSKNQTQDGKGLVAPADDLDRTRAVMDVIKARAASANKRQVKRKTH